MTDLLPIPMPDAQTFLLPSRAYLLSMRDQNLPLRRAALDDAEVLPRDAARQRPRKADLADRARRPRR
jgi:hypothetical protein